MLFMVTQTNILDNPSVSKSEPELVPEGECHNIILIYNKYPNIIINLLFPYFTPVHPPDCTFVLVPTLTNSRQKSGSHLTSRFPQVP